MNNLYGILGVHKNSTPEEIKTAYRNLAKIHHPDKGGSKEEFSRIQEAYDVLSDAERKVKYDQTGETEKERGFEEQFFGFVASQIIPIIEQAKDLNFDLMKEAKDHIEGLIRIGKKNIHELMEKKAHFEQAIERCKSKNGKENIMAKILQSKLDHIKNVKIQVESELQFIEKCLVEIDNFDYDFTEMPKKKDWVAIDIEQVICQFDLKGFLNNKEKKDDEETE